jgi:hypothetical protein
MIDPFRRWPRFEYKLLEVATDAGTVLGPLQSLSSSSSTRSADEENA